MRTGAVLAVALWGVGFAPPALADSERIPWFQERLLIKGGGWFSFSTSHIRAKAGGTTIAKVDLEDDLNVDEFAAVPEVGVSLRFLKRNRLFFNWFEIDRSGTTTLDLDFGIPQDTVVNTQFRIDTYRLAYAFSILHRENMELAITAGVHVLDVTLRVRADPQLIDPCQPVVDPDPGEPDDCAELDASENLTAPLPNAGLSYDYAFNDKMKANIQFLYMNLNYKDIEGSIFSGDLAFTYMMFNHVGINVGYRFLGLTGAGKNDFPDPTDPENTIGTKLEVDDFSHGPMLDLVIRF